jgi:1-acyl-sn-glycerol-3-phosphate acyltransferase
MGQRVTAGAPMPREGPPVSWAHGPAAQAVRSGLLCYVLGPIVRHYTHTRVVGLERLETVTPPVVLAANHSSHLDTPIILGSLPPDWRRKTAVVAAADYFYRNPITASVVSLAFGTVPIDRRSRRSSDSTERLAAVLQASLNILLYPEGTRSRDGSMGLLRSGAGRLATDHGVPLVPISLTGTHEAMPPGRLWPRRHPVVLRFGTPLFPLPEEDHKRLTVRLRAALAEMRALDEAE